MISLKWFRLVVFIFIPSLLLAADPLFEPRADYAAGVGGNSVFGADLDGDGDMDLVLGGNGVTVLKNNGDGSFQASRNYSTLYAIESVWSTDLDGDGDMDLAATGTNSGTIILKNNGDGTFQGPTNYSPGGFSIFGADLDGDGDSDLATANMLSGRVYVFKNNGDGSFQAAVSYAVGGDCWPNPSCWPFSVYGADLDGDGDVDLATANRFGWNVSVLENNGDGSFQAAVNSDRINELCGIFIADFELDGDMDVVVADKDGGAVYILKNNGDGTFQSPVGYSVGGGITRNVFSGDLDEDGDMDLAVAYAYANWGTVSIFMNLSIIVCTSKPGDANGSGVPDLTDVIYLVNYIFKGSTAPYPLCRGDANGSGGNPNLSDLIYLINYVFKAGPAPVPSGRCCL